SNRSTPAPFVLIHNALPDEVHRVLVGHALAQEAEAQQQQQNGISGLHLSPLEEAVGEAFRAHVEKARINVSIPETGPIDAQFELFAIGDSQSISWKKETNEIGFLIYQFH